MYEYFYIDHHSTTSRFLIFDISESHLLLFYFLRLPELLPTTRYSYNFRTHSHHLKSLTLSVSPLSFSMCSPVPSFPFFLGGSQRSMPSLPRRMRRSLLLFTAPEVSGRGEGDYGR
jgi:hypothetical protein